MACLSQPCWFGTLGSGGCLRPRRLAVPSAIAQHRVQPRPPARAQSPRRPSPHPTSRSEAVLRPSHEIPNLFDILCTVVIGGATCVGSLKTSFQRSSRGHLHPFQLFSAPFFSLHTYVEALELFQVCNIHFLASYIPSHKELKHPIGVEKQR